MNAGQSSTENRPAAPELSGQRLSEDTRAAAESATAEQDLRAAYYEKCAEAGELRSRLDEIERSRGWQLLQAVHRLRYTILPRGSRRERVARWFVHKQRRLQFYARQGPGPLARAIGRGLRAPFMPKKTRHRPLITAPLSSGPDDQPAFPGQVAGLVSVILPVYNQAALLGESVASVLAQTYADFELIIVNDGSTDDFAGAVAQFLSDKRIRVLTQANQKLPKALSAGFDFARGEFWTWTSADNLMEPAQLEKMVAFLRAHPEAALVYSDYLAIDDRGQPLRATEFRPQNRRKPDSPEIRLPRTPAELNTTQDNFIGAAFLYRGWAGRLLGDYLPSQGVEDYDYWMRMNDLFPIRHLGTDDLLYRYRVHDNTLNARAVTHHIYERAARLMSYERDRAWYYRQHWTIYADEATATWLGGLKLAGHTLRRFDPEQRLAGGTGKKLLLVRADTLPQLLDRPLPPEAAVAAWFAGDAPAPYRYAVEIQHCVDICCAADNATLSRLGLITRAALRAAPGQGLLDLLLAYANNCLFARKTIPDEDVQRRLPGPYVAPGRKLRVLLQVDNFLQGGLEHVVVDIAGTLDPQRFESALLVLGREGPAVAKARQRGLPVLRLEGADREAAYRVLLRDRGIDVVNAHFSLFGARIAAELGIPFVQTIHNTYVWLSAEQAAEHRAADAYTAGYVCVSHAVAAYADLRLGLPAAKMVVVPNGIDTRALDAARESLDRPAERAALGFGPDDFVFLCTASLTEVKAQLFLVQALAQALREDSRIRVALLGRPEEGGYESSYARLVQAEIERLGVGPAVKFLGYHKEPQKFYYIADAFVLPSFIEGWSLALAEALYAGLPIVASDVGAARELLLQTGGRLLDVPYGSLFAVDEYRFYNQIRAKNPEFVWNLTAALIATAKAPEPPALAAKLRRSFAREHAYRSYGQIYQWVASGGTSGAARPWACASTISEPRAEASEPVARVNDPPPCAGDTGAAPRKMRAFEPAERTLGQVLARAANARGVLIFPLSIPWANWLFQRPHHMARQLARRGYLVIYDDNQRFTGFAGFKEIEPDLYLFRGDPAQLRKFRNPTLWTYCYNYHLRDEYAAPTVIYDLIDEFRVHPHDPKLMQRNHDRALREAALVTYVARRLEQHLGERADRLYLPNGVEYSHFASEATPLPRDPHMRRLLAEGKPIAGYYGALAEWFAYELLEQTARRRSDWNFVLIGPQYDATLASQPLLGLPNVTWLGPRDYAVLPAYLRNFTVATIPFSINDITLATSPLKLYEYFAAGKPVITTALPECMAFSQVQIVRDATEFAAALDASAARGQDADFRTRVQAIARDNSWAARVEAVEQRLVAAMRAVAVR